MSPAHRPDPPAAGRVSAAGRLAAAAGGVVLAGLVSHLMVEAFWSFDPALYPSRFPWGTEVSPGSAESLEKALGALALSVLAVPAALELLGLAGGRSRREGA